VKSLYHFILISSFTLLTTSLVFAQDFPQALRTGNFRVLSSSFNANVELNFLGNEGFYSKAQAEQILKDFMQKNIPSAYFPKHQGVSKDGSQYIIGVLETNTGLFRTYIYMQKVGEVQFIKEMRIERER
jgi:hypothetical protein